MSTTKEFPKGELEGLEYVSVGGGSGPLRKIHEEFIDETRWGLIYQVVFCDYAEPEFLYAYTTERPATEMQDMGFLESEPDPVPCKQVTKKTIETVVYE